ncbi:MAG: transcriptional regulator [Acidobacteriia bacterium]|nr:transcriptional regulator [Terriglobia bacterium]MYG04577.1 transcriptional regulator [Terriglobia bacterium]MYK10664.1 transcriptional regulator [Terriglobia bacterium]
MTKAFDKIMAGLDDAHAYLNGGRGGFTVHRIEVPDPDVVAIRSKTGLSQPAFAQSIGIPLGTLKNWEQGRRRPEGPARVLLALIDKRPSIVQDELGR